MKEISNWPICRIDKRSPHNGKRRRMMRYACAATNADNNEVDSVEWESSRTASSNITGSTRHLSCKKGAAWRFVLKGVN